MYAAVTIQYLTAKYHMVHWICGNGHLASEAELRLRPLRDAACQHLTGNDVSGQSAGILHTERSGSRFLVLESGLCLWTKQKLPLQYTAAHDHCRIL